MSLAVPMACSALFAVAALASVVQGRYEPFVFYGSMSLFCMIFGAVLHG